MSDRELARESAPYPPFYPNVPTRAGGLLCVKERYNDAGGIEGITLEVGGGTARRIYLTGGEARTLAFHLRDAAERWQL